MERNKPADLFDESHLLLLRCEDISFFTICETFIRDPHKQGPLHSICSLMRKSQAKWLMIDNGVEKYKNFPEKYPAVYEEVKHLKEKYPVGRIKVRQLTFFGSDIKWPPKHKKQHEYLAGDRPTRKKNSVLASCVIISLTYRNRGIKKVDYIYEAVMALPSVVKGKTRVELLNNYIHVFAPAEIQAGGYGFEFKGCYFCQQNGINSVCAHSCLKMAMWHAREVNEYQPSTKTINNIVKEMRRKHREKFYPSKGLKVQEITKICNEFGLNTFSVDFTKSQHQNISPYELTYLLIESGIPTILVFKPQKGGLDSYHMVPVIGHTMNTDEWFPLAIREYKDFPPSGLNTREHDYLSSAEWASHLVIHDDLLGPYLCITPQSLTRYARPDEDLAGRACYVFGILPKGLNTLPSPVVAQEIGGVYFWNIWSRLSRTMSPPWKQRLIRRWGEEKNRFKNIVLRTQLVSGDSYVEHLEEMVDHEKRRCYLTKEAKTKILKKMPRLMWMVEFSLPELYSANRTKLGEITMAVETAENEKLLNLQEGQVYEPPISYRLLGALDLFDGEVIDLNIRSHTELYRRTLHEFEY